MMTWASWMYVCSCAYSFCLGILKDGEWTQSGNKLGKKAWVYEMYKHKDHPGLAFMQLSMLYVRLRDSWWPLNFDLSTHSKFELGLVIKLFIRSLQFALNTEARKFSKVFNFKQPFIHKYILQIHHHVYQRSCILFLFLLFCCNPIYFSKECQ